MYDPERMFKITFWSGIIVYIVLVATLAAQGGSGYLTDPNSAIQMPIKIVQDDPATRWGLYIGMASGAIPIVGGIAIVIRWIKKHMRYNP